jgi:hypothetical protein
MLREGNRQFNTLMTAEASRRKCSILVKARFANEGSPYVPPNRIVDSENLNGHLTNLRLRNQIRAVPYEMVTPPVLARVEQRDDSSCFLVPTRNIGAFAPIAAPTSQGQVLKQRLAAMLDR